MIGVVLSGGLSTRMGKDKGLMTTQGKAWARVAFEKLTTNSASTFISINDLQQQEYLRHFSQKELIVDNLSLKIQGPLSGLLSVHLLHPDQDIMVLACDMLNMKSSVLQKLEQEFYTIGPEAIVFKKARVEPLCAIYSAKGLAKISERHESSRLTKYSMHFVLEQLQTTYLPLPSEWESFFHNFNRPEELQ